MTKFAKFIAAGIIILALIFGALIGCKITKHIRQDLQVSFKDSLTEYGKR